MTILTWAGEARSVSRKRTARLSGGQSALAAIAALLIVVVGAEGAVSSDGTRIVAAIPGHHTTETTRAPTRTETSAQVHAIQAIDQQALVTLRHGRCSRGNRLVCA
jgi:hypothetical protein